MGILKKEKIVFISTILIFVAGLIFILMPCVFAASDVGTDSVDFLGNLVNNAASAFKIGEDGGFASDFKELAKNVFHLIQLAAITWVMVVLLTTIIKESLYNQASIDTMVKYLMKMLIAFLIIIYTGPILDALDDAGNQILTLICGIDYGDRSELYTTLQEFGGSIIFTFISAYLMITYYGMCIELVLRYTLMPLAVGNIVTEGVRSSGYKFIKRYVAIYLKIGMMILTVAVAIDMACTTSVTDLDAGAEIVSGVLGGVLGSVLGSGLGVVGGAVGLVGGAAGAVILLPFIIIMFGAFAFLGKISGLVDELLGN